MTRNQIAYFEASEKQRANLAAEALRRAEIQESVRHNTASEQLTSTQLAEQGRHNVVAEQTDWARVNEAKRHNQVSEQIDLFDANTKRYVAQSNASIAAKQLTETIRSNKAKEAIQWDQNAVARSQIGATIYASNNAFNSSAGTQKIETLKLQETVRHNKATEETQLRTSTAGMVKTAGDWAMTLLGWKVKGGK